MTRSVFVREIITILKEPRLCPTCKKEDRLEKGIIDENRSGGKTILCSRCEALIVVTNHKESIFYRMGLSDQEIVVLMIGGHANSVLRFGRP